MAILNGTTVTLLLAGDPVAYATNVSFDLSAAEVDQTTKDSAGNKGVRPGLIGGTAKVSGFAAFVTPADTFGVAALEALRSGRGAGSLSITVGSVDLAAEVRLTDCSIVAGVEDNLTFDASFKFSGPITFS